MLVMATLQQELQSGRIVTTIFILSRLGESVKEHMLLLAVGSSESAKFVNSVR